VSGIPRSTRFALDSHHPSDFLRLGECPECEAHLEKWHRIFCAMVYAECQDWHLAEDIAQQATVAMAKRGHKMLTDTYGYRLKMMRWKLTDHWRGRKNAALVCDDDEVLDCEVEMTPPPWLDMNITPELQGALQALPDRQRQVVKATYFEDKDDVEIAHTMQISISTLQNYRYLGLKRLKALLEKHTK
jgi:RNA polymerase sigma factor (sigma-70 family)